MRERCDRHVCLCDWYVFRGWRERVHQLCRGYLPGQRGLLRLLSLFRGHLLGLGSKHMLKLRYGYLPGQHGRHCMCQLFGGLLFGSDRSEHLLQLRRRSVPGVNGVNKLQFLFARHLLEHHGRHRCFELFKLSRGGHLLI